MQVVEAQKHGEAGDEEDHHSHQVTHESMVAASVSWEHLRYIMVQREAAVVS